MALGTPTKGKPLGTYNGNIRESQRVKGLRSKLSPKEILRLLAMILVYSSYLSSLTFSLLMLFFLGFLSSFRVPGLGFRVGEGI